VGLRDVFGISGKAELLLKHYGLTSEDIAEAALRVVAQKAGRV
jgi:transketolase C-terminal domain/subunit